MADHSSGTLLFYKFGLATKPGTTPLALVKEPVNEPPKAAAKCTDVITWLSLALTSVLLATSNLTAPFCPFWAKAADLEDRHSSVRISATRAPRSHSQRR